MPAIEVHAQWTSWKVFRRATFPVVGSVSSVLSIVQSRRCAFWRLGLGEVGEGLADIPSACSRRWHSSRAIFRFRKWLRSTSCIVRAALYQTALLCNFCMGTHLRKSRLPCRYAFASRGILSCTSRKTCWPEKWLTESPDCYLCHFLDSLFP